MPLAEKKHSYFTYTFIYLSYWFYDNLDKYCIYKHVRISKGRKKQILPTLIDLFVDTVVQDKR